MSTIGRNKLGAAALAAMLALMTPRSAGRDALPGGAPLPPEANPVEIDVPRGGPVWIPLSADSLTSRIIRYRIWRKPAAGQLGTPRLVTAGTGAVRYRPPAGAGPGEDSFAYEVQSEAGVSAPAEVHIRITDRDPHLVAPIELDFGYVPPGQSARRALVLQNIGGGMAEGNVRVPDGWMVEGEADYRLGAGEKRTFTLVFKPAEARAYTGDIEYTGDLDRATDLVGTGAIPVAATPPGAVDLTGTIALGAVRPVAMASPAATPPKPPPVRSVALNEPAPAAEIGLPSLPEDTGDAAAPEAVPRIMRIGVENAGRDGARVTCAIKGLPPSLTYRIETQGVRRDAQGKPEAVWTPFARAVVAVDGPTVTASLAHLQPGALYVVRMVGLDGKGRITAISATAPVWTPRAPKGGMLGWVGLAAVAAAVFAAWRRFRKNGRSGRFARFTR